MADNYLEKRMEEYRAGRLAPKTTVKRNGTAARRPGDLILNFPQLNVVVFGGADTELTEAVARAFRGVDGRVALCHGDSRRFTPFAQATGCRYYPFDAADSGRREWVIDDIAGRWGSVDVTVDLVDAGEGDDSVDAGRLAELVVIHSHPGFGFIETTVTGGFEE